MTPAPESEVDVYKRQPKPSTKMNTGSSTMLVTAPISTLSMAVVAKPWALMKALSPSAVSYTHLSGLKTAFFDRAPQNSLRRRLKIKKSRRKKA